MILSFRKKCLNWICLIRMIFELEQSLNQINHSSRHFNVNLFLDPVPFQVFRCNNYKHSFGW